MKIAIITQNKADADRVFTPEIRMQIQSFGELYPTVLCRKNLKDHRDFLRECEVLFSTWGMEHFSTAEIQEFFPKVRYLYYAAGSVQGFAREFLECGVRVFSAWRANAVPVAEYTAAQIILAAKGYFMAQRRCKQGFYPANRQAQHHTGNYHATIGIVGAGAIGSMVCQKLRAVECTVLCCDPFITMERAQELGVEKVEITELFERSDVISNHLANKEELAGFYHYGLFQKMKPYATFINTGRGRQVINRDLNRILRERKDLTAVLDVTDPEPLPPFSPLRRRKNLFLTPHIAGSTGREVERMAAYMIDELSRLSNGEPPQHEVLMEMLATMA